MDRERWRTIGQIFNDALDRSPRDRDAFLDEACADDASIRETVDALLAEYGEDPGFLETPLAQVSRAEGPEIGEERSIGPYRVVRLLGRGGMGEVFLATQEGEGFRRPVAIKVLRAGSAGPEALERFRLERRILAGLTHPNIARLLDGGATDNGLPYVVMEYVEGVPIDAFCDNRCLGVGQRLELFRQVCDAVQYAHRQLVVHRDIKPGNVLVGDDGVPKLLDFGIGKPLDDERSTPDLTRTGMRYLTPGYASPEQVRGERVTVASDVYQLGVLLYELLTGHLPHGEGTPSPVDFERAVLDSEPLRPSAAVSLPATRHRAAGTVRLDTTELARRRATDAKRLPRLLRGDLDTIVLMALRREPDRRYTSAGALSDDVRRYLEGQPVRARPDTLTYRVAKFVRRNAVAVASTAAVFLALAGATVNGRVQSRRVIRERDRAVEVQGFLLEMFGASAPDRSAADTVTARQLLDRQAEALETTYAEEPELRARMMTVLAEGYDRLGLNEEAERLAREGLRIRRVILPPRHPDIAASLALLGWILHQGGDTEGGEALLREAIPIWRAARPRNPRGLSRALNDLGVVRDAAGDYDEAGALYREALELRRQGFGPTHRSVGVSASNLSVIRYRQGDYAGAVEAGEEALAVMRAAVGPDHQRSIVIQGNLAAIRLALGDLPGAEREYRDLLERQTRLQGPDHPVTLGLRASLASALANQFRWAEAEIVYRELLELLVARLGPEHPQVATIQLRLAETLVGLDRTAEAVQPVERAHAVLLERYGPDDIRVGRATEMLANVRMSMGKPEESEALHRTAVAIFDRALEAGHPETGLVRMRLAHRLMVRGRSVEALATYDSAWAILQGQLPDTHRAFHEIRLRRARIALDAGRLPEADSLLSAARAAFARGGEDDTHRAMHDSMRVTIDSLLGIR